MGHTQPAVARILLVDDSASARALIGVRLRDMGHDVVEVARGAEAAELALEDVPDAVVTDLWMPGISGVQLCRLLRAEPATSEVPIVLLTASGDRRSRFWARHAGADAYVTKTEIDSLVHMLGDLTTAMRTRPPPSMSASVVMHGDVQERLSQLLDTSLFESTIAGEVRALAQNAEEIEHLFEGLAALASEVAGYRWLALVTDTAATSHARYRTRLFIHTHPDHARAAEGEVRDALAIPPPLERRKPPEGDAFIVADERADLAELSAAPIFHPVRFGDRPLGLIAMSPSRRRGATHEEHWVMKLLSNELGGPLRMASLVAEARRLASTDSLTGLLNRRAFVERIDKARKASKKPMFPMSVLLLDVDHFKQVNDTLGHDAGDAVLQGIARVLGSIARTSDLVARWGGEEFVVALPQTAEAGARVAAERVRRAIAEAEHPLPDGTAHRATASVGLASAEGPSWSIDELLGRADKAMYAAKNRGRNRVEIG